MESRSILFATIPKIPYIVTTGDSIPFPMFFSTKFSIIVAMCLVTFQASTGYLLLLHLLTARTCAEAFALRYKYTKKDVEVPKRLVVPKPQNI